MADKIALALSYHQRPDLDSFLDSLEYDFDDQEGIRNYNLGKQYFAEFKALGFSIEHLEEIFRDTFCEY